MRNEHTDAEILLDLQTVTCNTLGDVFGYTELSMVITRIDQIFGGILSSVRNSANPSDICLTATDKVAKLVTVSVSYVELYNLNTGRTFLTLPRATSVKEYHV